jgi:serine/threonine protein kinase
MRLNRDVAIKVLPDELASEPERLRRFEREARAASALSHPNIVTIYEVAREGATAFIAMELVAGKTLRAVIGGAPVPLRRILAIAPQIADGLARAHASGIIHRDLKPENVMVTEDGHIKILDFGLAKLTHPGEESGGTQPTVSMVTRPGIAMGTASYMSPEQALGHPLDYRSDQFSLGAILYELATGKVAFRRDSTPQTLAAIIEDEPEPIGLMAPRTPAPLRWIIQRCLAKEAKSRYASTEDLARELTDLRDHVSELLSGSAAELEPAKRRRQLPGSLLAALFLLMGAAIAWIGSHRAAPEPPRYHRLTFHRGDVGGARFTPDGQTIVYSASSSSHPSRQLFLTRPEATESTALALPSADILGIASTGTMLIGLQPRPEASSAGGDVLTVAEAPLAGGAPRPLLEGVRNADLSPDGRNIAVVRHVEGRNRLECPMGKLLEEKSDRYFDFIRFSPDGRSLAVIETVGSEGSGEGNESIVLRDLATGNKRVLSTGWQYMFGMAWNPRTREIWFSSREAEGRSGPLALHAVSLTGSHRVVARGPDSLVVRDISGDGRVLLTRGDFSQTAICLPPGAAKEVDLSWHSLSEISALSEDGRFILLNDLGVSSGSVETVYLRATDGSPAVKLGEGYGQSISPDGRWALVKSVKLNRLMLLPTGPGQPRALLGTGMIYGGAEFFPDGKRVLFSASAGDGPKRLWIQDVDGGQPRPLTPEGFELGPISPDGKWIVTRGPSSTATERGSGGEPVLFAVDGGEQRRISGATTEDRIIRFDATGEALFVAAEADILTMRVMVVRLDLSTGRREPWKEVGPADSAGVPGIGVYLTPDGKSYAYWFSRFLETLFIVDGLR